MRVRTSHAIGAAIRSRRHELKLDQDRLARKIGATRQWLIAIEKGKDTAELGMVLRALVALDLELDLRPIGAPNTALLPVEPLPILDIDAIADSAQNRRVSDKAKTTRGAEVKARKIRKVRQAKRRG